MNFQDKNIAQEENRLAADKMLIVFGSLFIAYILNLLGVFYIDKRHFGICFYICSALALLIQLIGRIGSFSSKRYTKYIIISLCAVMTLVELAFLNYHSILSLCIPMIIAINYHSKKMVIASFGLTLIDAVLWPILGVYYGLWDENFIIYLIYLIDPQIISEDMMEASCNMGITLDPKYGLIEFVVIPQVGFAIVFGLITIISNVSARRSFRRQMKAVRDSRDHILAGMANIVENRDMSTGGHIRRTSEVVKLLVDALPKEVKEKEEVDEDYEDCVIRTAPMHDLGKIAIPDEILTKPSKLTAEEFEKIKIHPQKSYDILEEVLEGFNDKKLANTAGNIALYHHEKYDGTGYPKGLKGDEIPLEARIMAIADVYDALVSERCYKLPMSHEDAYNIIKESMGTHFDPKLWPCFEDAYPKICEYYA